MQWSFDFISKNFRKKIDLEAEEAFTVWMANLCELETDIDNMTKRMANPVIQNFEEELRLIQKKSSKDTKMLKTKVCFLSFHLVENQFNAKKI